MGSYKKRPVVLVIQAKAKIIRVIIHGSRDCLPYGEWKIRPGKVTVNFLEEISTDGMGYEDRDFLVDQLHKLVERKIQLQASTSNDLADVLS